MFTNTPESFSASLDKLIFEYEIDEVKDLTFEIRDAYTMGYIANKLFYDSSHVYVNIAPYIRELAEPTPTLGESGQATDVAGRGAVFVFRGIHASDPYKYIKNSCDAPQNSLLCAASTQRTIGADEQDIITIRADQDIAISLKSYTEGGEEVESHDYLITAEEDDIYNFRLNAAEFEGAASITLSFTIDQSTTTISYTIVNPGKGAKRIAWLNTMGGYEHYTFPRTDSEMATASDKRTIGCISALEPYDTISALSEVSFAPYAWLVDEQGYHPITIEDGTFNIIVNGQVSLAELKFSEDV